ncbi:hypothetical protein [Nocardia jiangsuensis]|uniref:Excreted virulence factor EspC (Type VII ESX diderm) n=1 Tax=Nocardia jiangsuensis TaxID=1691563 RepID=A0ABV8DXA4_9NOCA
MSEVAAESGAIHAYGAASAAMAQAVATAGAVDQVATVAATVPVFGLIGQDFLAAFAVAQANHISSVLELAAVHAATALTAHEGAAAYDAGEAASAGALNAAR